MRPVALGVSALALLPLGATAVVQRADASSTIVRTFAHVTCVWPAATKDGVVACQRASGTGFVAIVARRFAMVKKSASGRILFFRNQPMHSAGYSQFNDKRVFHVENHRGISCAWAHTGGGTAVCNRADRHGYVIGISQRFVVVMNEASRAVFLRNQR
jgi:hypothetical protein